MTLPAVEIRPVLSSDLDAVFDLEELCFKDPYPPYFLSQLSEAHPDSFLVAVVDARVVGYGVVDEWGDHNHLLSIAVRPEVRKRGIGRRLLAALQEALNKEKPLRLEVRRSNVAAIELYSREGFRKSGVLERYYSDGEDAVLMEKPAARATPF